MKIKDNNRWVKSRKEIAIDYILKNPSLAYDMSLTKRELDVYQFCLMKKYVCTRDVAKFLKMSVQQAYNIMIILCKKGYLIRSRIPRTGSGGYEWLFKIKLKIPDTHEDY